MIHDQNIHPIDQIEEEMVETIEVKSKHLSRTVRIDLYKHNAGSSDHHGLLLVNDGQDLLTMNFENILHTVASHKPLNPLVVAAIHCGPDRTGEYGMSVSADFRGWGSKAAAYEKFVISELLPSLRKKFETLQFSNISYAGFSLGALNALDIAWNHPEIFSRVGVFSGALWWRSVDKDKKGYNPWTHRMMHHQVAQSAQRPGMKFFFECGEHDENEDRNKNGVIDSIDDTIDLMRLLVEKGYKEGTDFKYLQMADGKHDVPSWAKAFPKFLVWGWGGKFKLLT